MSHGRVNHLNLLFSKLKAFYFIFKKDLDKKGSKKDFVMGHVAWLHETEKGGVRHPGPTVT